MPRFFVCQLNFLIKFLAINLGILTISRLVLMSWLAERVESNHDFWMIVLGGLRIDLATLSGFLIIPLLGLLLHVLFTRSSAILHRIIGIYCWIMTIFVVFMEIATPTFIAEYDTRPNRLFFEYLKSPKEVLSMLMGGYMLPVIMSIVMIIIWGWFTREWLTRKWKPLHSDSYGILAISKSLLTSILLLMILIVGTRSGLQHRPINPAMVAIGQDRLINSLPLNSSYSVLYAIYQLKHEANASDIYGKIDQDKMVSLVQSYMPNEADFIERELPTLHTLSPSQSYKGKNLIIVVEESLGAQFVGSLGGKPLTPNIDKWREKSWFFDNLYATGTRSARGLEAITTGFLPSPARSVLKLPKAQEGFYSIAQTLAHKGYDTRFIYGGESHFDNMKGFFLASGFGVVIDQNDYKQPEFKATWGVSDEDLFNNALRYLKQLSDKPKFSLIFTSSNHTPFEFPDNKIELFEEKKQTVSNAVKYADFALGKFLEQLDADGFMDNSIILVVADHDARVFGAEWVPVSNFHIPGFIIGDDIKNHIDKHLVSQIDLAPTLLSLLGVNEAHPMVGQDLTQLPEGYGGRVIMQYGQTQAFWQDDQIVILRADMPAEQFQYAEGKYSPSKRKELIPLAIAHAQFASWAYNNKKYRLAQ